MSTYKVPTSDDILKALQEECSSSMSKVEGTFEYDVFSSNAIEFMKTYVELAELYKQAFADTASGDWLTSRASEAGVIRKEATQARGFVTVKGQGELPIGSRFSTVDGTMYLTTEYRHVNGSASVPIVAELAGKDGNASERMVSMIPANIPGITSVTNERPITDGFDEESDEELRKRYLIHVRTPGTSGNKFHYYEWAMSIPGVGMAKVLPLHKGPGTVGVVIVNSEFKAASSQLVNDVQTYIDSVRPVGATVTVMSATMKTVNISAKVSASDGFDKDRLTELLQDYFVSLERKGTTNNKAIDVSIAKIGGLILQAGADDYTNLTINGGTVNIAIQPAELAVLGTLTIT